MINLSKLRNNFLYLVITFCFCFYPSFADNINTDLSKINDDKDFDEFKTYKSNYILGPGDSIYIKFSGLEIFSRSYSINPDGYLNLPEINLFLASGKTTEELREELIRKYKNSIKNPVIDIFITQYKPVNFLLKGEVRRPGIYKLDYQNESTSLLGENTLQIPFSPSYINSLPKNSTLATAPKLSDALRQGLGFKVNSDLSKITITRKNSKTQGGGKIKTKIDLIRLLHDGDLSQNIDIHDGDVIYVPRSEIPMVSQLNKINKSNLTPDVLEVYINGNVQVPGRVTIPQGSSLYEAIASVGGRGSLSGNIIFMRFREDSSTEKRIIRYNPKSPKGSNENPLMNHGDIVFISKNILGKTTQTIKEVGSPIINAYGLYKIFN